MKLLCFLVTCIIFIFREYKYRLLVAQNEIAWEMGRSASLTSFAEKNYSWILRSGFDPYKASFACRFFQVVF